VSRFPSPGDLQRRGLPLGFILDNSDVGNHIWSSVKLSNKGRYGVRAIFDIAFHSAGKATQIKDISRRQAIPPRFLEQIFQDLKRAGLVTSKRGPRGGYALAMDADDVRIGDIVRALEGPIALASADGNGEGDETSRVVTENAFSELSDSIEACFDAITIQDLCDRGDAHGVRRAPPRRYVYSI
jgi:Rrf2 family protein